MKIMSLRGRKTTMFKKNNIPWNKGLKTSSQEDNQQSFQSLSATQIQEPSTSRMTEEEFAMVCTTDVTGDCLSTPDCDGKSGHVRLLRPKKVQSPSLERDDRKCSGMRLVDFEKVSEAFNDAFCLHMSDSETENSCSLPNFIVGDEKKVGLGWKISLKCTNCNFTAPQKKLYKEAESSRRGPKPAAANIGLAVGLQDTPMGNSRCRTLLASMNIPPPSRSAMQATSNLVGETVTKLNKRDMAEKLDMVKSINKARGNEESSINIAMDGRYNSACISSRRKPGQNASQSIGIACETMTDKQYIVSTATQNKLCWTGSWLRSEGFYEVQCPGGHEGCTANTYGHAPLSEYELGKAIGQDLAVQGAFVKFVTTDGDSKSAAGVAEAIRLLDPMWRVERLADPTHLGQAQFKKCYNAKYSDGMFPAKTREKRVEQQKVLSQDIKARTSLIVKEMMKVHAGDVNKMKADLPNVLRATVRCYSGDCSLCRRHSYVCSGGVTNSWWTRSMFLACHKLTGLCMEDSDEHLLREILKIKLSEASIQQMRLGTSTQKCEAVNRSISVSLPKNVNYSKNMEGRLASTVLRLNNGQAKSTEKILAEFGVELSDDSKKSLEQIQHEQEYHKTYAKTPTTLKRTLKNKGRYLNEHLQFKKRHSATSDYKKGQLDPKGDKSDDHNYCQD